MSTIGSSVETAILKQINAQNTPGPRRKDKPTGSDVARRAADSLDLRVAGVEDSDENRSDAEDDITRRRPQRQQALSGPDFSPRHHDGELDITV